MAPKAVDRPHYANHPIGRMMYGLMSYLYAFQRNVLARTGKMVATGVKGIDPETGTKMKAGERLTMAAGPAAALMAMAAAGTIISDVRERTLNPSFNEQRTTGQKLMLGLSRSGVFGAADPLVNGALAGLKYQRDLSNFVIGAGPSFVLQNGQRMISYVMNNSDNTNTAEWNAVKGAYDVLVMPALVAALSVVPGGRAVGVAAGAGIQAVTSPEVRKNIADAVAGEKKVPNKKQQQGAGSKGKASVGSAPTRGR
jgi:hypothetical protein